MIANMNDEITRKQTLRKLADKLFSKPDAELEDYGDFFDEMDITELNGWLNDPDARAWLERWDAPRLARLENKLKQYEKTRKI